MKVGPCIRDPPGPRLTSLASSSEHSTADWVRYPPVMDFPTTMMSGTISAHSHAKSLPVRPNPVATSSAIRTRSSSSARRRRCFRQDGDHGHMPPAPCKMGSTMIPARSSRWVSRISSASLHHVSTSASSAAKEGGRGRKICWGIESLNMACMPPIGSHTLIAPRVSP